MYVSARQREAHGMQSQEPPGKEQGPPPMASVLRTFLGVKNIQTPRAPHHLGRVRRTLTECLSYATLSRSQCQWRSAPRLRHLAGSLDRRLGSMESGRGAFLLNPKAGYPSGRTLLEICG